MLEDFHHLTHEQLLSFVRQNAFYLLLTLIFAYITWNSSTCIKSRNAMYAFITKNPERDAKFERRRKEVRLKQAIQFEKELDKKREQAKKGTNSVNVNSSNTYQKPKRRPYVARGYNPLTGSGGGGGGYKPSSRMRKSGG
jgi:hypothetical protein